MGLQGLGIWAGLNSWAGLNGLAEELLREVLDALEVESVEELEREHNLVELDLAGGPLKDAGAAGDGEICVLVRQIRALNGNVTVVSEVETVDGLVSVSFLLRLVLDQNADSCGYAHALLHTPCVQLVAEGDEITEGIDRFLTQSENSRTSTVPLVDLVNVQLLDFLRVKRASLASAGEGLLREGGDGERRSGGKLEIGRDQRRV